MFAVKDKSIVDRKKLLSAMEEFSKLTETSHENIYRSIFLSVQQDVIKTKLKTAMPEKEAEDISLIVYNVFNANTMLEKSYATVNNK